MRKHVLLAISIILILIVAYSAYVLSYPKYPEVDNCINPFKVVRPIARVQKNWSKIHIFF
ncbi:MULTISPECIES: hypothetical protein [Pyrococcus]|uniref:hypothetical protein n=1 Tax=Pyrococcus TaxID=2260 RepID=UPI00064FA391|nr:hypothetical protein [Pyrococcus furiosus]MDK2869544.1 hypothetical protein [Pyrococcus sp.]